MRNWRTGAPKVLNILHAWVTRHAVIVVET